MKYCFKDWSQAYKRTINALLFFADGIIFSNKGLTTTQVSHKCMYTYVYTPGTKYIGGI